MRKARAVLLVVALLVGTGCGSSSGSPMHDYAEIEKCLNDWAGDSGLTASTDSDRLDSISANAGQGAIALHGDRQEVQVSVERSGSDAKQTAKNYEPFFGGDAGDRLSVDGNVVAAYTKTPTDEERAVVERCVKDPSGY